MRIIGSVVAVIGAWCMVAVSAAAPLSGRENNLVSSSQYVRMRDGIRLAADVWTSAAGEGGVRKPVILMLTRYWRAFDSPGHELDAETLSSVEYFASAGYAVVIADMRGTGASFGSRSTEFSNAELQDYGNLISWIAAQPWCNGRVATLGASYLGNAAEFSAISMRPALRAVVPEFSDFSEYRDAIRPGGISNSVIARAWVRMTAALDRNNGCAVYSSGSACTSTDPWYFGVRPAASDVGLHLLRQALSEHLGNVDLTAQVQRLVYSDDRFGLGSADTLDAISVSDRWRLIDKAHVPAFHWASWFDGGTAEGALTRFINYHTPIYVVIGAWNHGGTSDANPYDPDEGRVLSKQTLRQHFNEIRRFLAPLMEARHSRRPATLGLIRYFTVGVNQWHTTRVWPPPGLRKVRWYFGQGATLNSSRPNGSGSSDVYKVNFLASTGVYNRWHTQLGTYVRYPDRRQEDRLLLTYTSRKVRNDTEVTGSAVLRVYLASSVPDGALFAYLEDVAPDGRVTYLTEGEIRLLFGGRGLAHPGLKTLGPLHTFIRAEARPLRPGKVAMFWFALRPISVVIPRGDRIRVAISGADAETFERIPAKGPGPTWRVLRDAAYPSNIDLPMRRWKP